MTLICWETLSSNEILLYFTGHLCKNGNNSLGSKLSGRSNCANSLSVPNIFMAPYIQNNNPHGTLCYSSPFTEDMTAHFKIATLELSIYKCSNIASTLKSVKLSLQGPEII